MLRATAKNQLEAGTSPSTVRTHTDRHHWPTATTTEWHHERRTISRPLRENSLRSSVNRTYTRDRIMVNTEIGQSVSADVIKRGVGWRCAQSHAYGKRAPGPVQWQRATPKKIRKNTDGRCSLLQTVTYLRILVRDQYKFCCLVEKLSLLLRFLWPYCLNQKCTTYTFLVKNK